MPRVTKEKNLGRRNFLVVCWQHIPELFGLLSPGAKMELHRFYGPRYTLTDNEFVARMRWAIREEPSIAQKVGKHYNVIFSTFKRYSDQVGKCNWEMIRELVVREYTHVRADPTTREPVVILAIANPAPDVAKLAYALSHRAAAVTLATFARHPLSTTLRYGGS